MKKTNKKKFIVVGIIILLLISLTIIFTYTRSQRVNQSARGDEQNTNTLDPVTPILQNDAAAIDESEAIEVEVNSY